MVSEKKINLLHGAERYAKNSGVVSYCVDLKPSAKVLFGDWSTSYSTISCLQSKQLFPFMITSVIMTAQQIETCFLSQEKEKLRSIKNLHSTVYGTVADIMRGNRGSVNAYSWYLFVSCLLQEERNAWGQTWCHGPASLDSMLEHHGTGWYEVPKFSWVAYCCWSASWALCSNILHSWRWKQQNLPLHILDSAMHCRNERKKVKTI